MPPRTYTNMNTYVTHPWVARDRNTGYPLLLNGEIVFFPQSERNGKEFTDTNRDIIDIFIPGKSNVKLDSGD